MPINYTWSESNNVVPQGSAAIHGDDDSNWFLGQPPAPGAIVFQAWAFDQQDMPTAGQAAHFDDDAGIPSIVRVIPPNRGLDLWLFEQGEMPLLQTVDDGGIVFYTAFSGGLTLLDPNGWAQDEAPTPVTPIIDEEWFHLPRMAVAPVPPVLFTPYGFDSSEIVPQPSATVDEVHGPWNVGNPPVIPPPSQPIIWFYEQGEQPASLFGQHEEDGWQPFPVSPIPPSRLALSFYQEDYTQPANTISEEDGERYWQVFVMRQDRPIIHRFLPWFSGWDVDGVPVPFVDAPPSPTSLVVMTGNTRMLYVADNGAVMPSPVSFTAGTTGPYRMALVGSNGARENLAGATVTLVVQSVNAGTPVVNQRQLSIESEALGEVSWDRTSTETADAGDYLMQTKVVRSDTTVGRYPDGTFGDPLTMLPALGA